MLMEILQSLLASLHQFTPNIVTAPLPVMQHLAGVFIGDEAAVGFIGKHGASEGQGTSQAA